MKIFKKENPLDNDSLIIESKGLKLLEETLNQIPKNLIKIPKLISVSKELLELENINTTSATSTQMSQLGISLANLHNIKFEQCGLEYDNFIGLSTQRNVLSNNWGEFFFELRLKEQTKRIKNNILRENYLNLLNEKKNNIIEFLNENTSHISLVHGDLWSGNAIFSKDSIYLIDPAIYYGDSEVDIAMTEMFGGFSSSFYEAYTSKKPLSKNYPRKSVIYNLYHYLNHYNLFGNAYLNSLDYSFKGIKTL